MTNASLPVLSKALFMTTDLLPILYKAHFCDEFVATRTL